MKKLVLFFAVACAVSFAACNNNAATTEATEEAVAVETPVCACDSCVCDSCNGECAVVECAKECAEKCDSAAAVVVEEVK